MGAWFEERIVYQPDHYIINKNLYDDYTVWCAQNGEKAAASNIFGKRLKRLPGYREKRFSDKRTNKERGWVGIALLATPVHRTVFGETQEERLLRGKNEAAAAAQKAAKKEVQKALLARDKKQRGYAG